MTPDPTSPAPRQPDSPPVPAAPSAPPQPHWFRRFASVIFIIFCLELGLFLLIYPWTDSWAGNYFSWLGPAQVQAVWHGIWIKGYVRGAISGIGLINIWIAIAEALRMYIGGNDDGE